MTQQKQRLSLLAAFKCAFSGIGYAIATQRNMKIHIVCAVLALILGFVFSLDMLEWLAIIGCIALVFAAEVMNTAIEAVVDLVSPDYSELAKRAKDCAAGAVLVLALFSLVVAAIVFGSALWEAVIAYG